MQRERAMREARTVAQIKHPNVIVVHDVVEQDGRPWIVMELVEGPSLADRLSSGGPVAPREAARIGIALLGALRAAHARGVLHRDIKPANVLMETGTGRVVLTDFGIAQVPGVTTLTEAGGFVGSPEYTAPERMAGRGTGPEADLWSLGVLLCAALSGESPFQPRLVGRCAARGRLRRDRTPGSRPPVARRRRRAAGAGPAARGWTSPRPSGCCAAICIRAARRSAGRAGPDAATHPAGGAVGPRPWRGRTLRAGPWALQPATRAPRACATPRTVPAAAGRRASRRRAAGTRPGPHAARAHPRRPHPQPYARRTQRAHPGSADPGRARRPGAGRRRPAAHRPHPRSPCWSRWRWSCSAARAPASRPWS